MHTYTIHYIIPNSFNIKLCWKTASFLSRRRKTFQCFAELTLSVSNTNSLTMYNNEQRGSVNRVMDIRGYTLRLEYCVSPQICYPSKHFHKPPILPMSSAGNISCKAFSKKKTPFQKPKEHVKNKHFFVSFRLTARTRELTESRALSAGGKQQEIPD